MAKSIGIRSPRSLRTKLLETGLAAAMTVRRTPRTFDPDSIESDAQVQAGHDLPDDLHREGLEVLCFAYTNEAQLTRLGVVMARTQLVTNLVNRIELHQWLRGNPQHQSSVVNNPIIIVGLPRTGTTILQQFLSLDPKLRTLRAWEASRPTPPPHSPFDADDERVATSVKAFRAVRLLAPDAAAIHHVEPQLPTECIALQANTMYGMEFAATSHLPSFLDWTLRTKPDLHIDAQIDHLKALQSGYPSERWVLKSPAHLATLTALADRFEGARFVWTHRDPGQAVVSHASLTTVLTRIGSARVDPSAIGKLWLDTWSRVVDSAVEARSIIGDERFFDLEHRQLVQNPIGSMARLNDWLGRPFDESHRATIDAHLNANPHEGRGRHRFEASDFGLDPIQISERFAGYQTWESGLDFNR